MPGRPFQSSLEPHLETIRALRLKRRTWRQVAGALKAEHGLEIDPAAIYKFFKRRTHPSARQPLGFPTAASVTSNLPTDALRPEGTAADLSFEPSDPDAENPYKMRKQPAPTSSVDGRDGSPSDGASTAPAKKYVFIPKPKRPSLFSEEDLQLNDPLAIEPFGRPADPEARTSLKKTPEDP